MLENKLEYNGTLCQLHISIEMYDSEVLLSILTESGTPMKLVCLRKSV